MRPTDTAERDRARSRQWSRAGDDRTFAGDALRVDAPTLLIVGGADPAVLELNEEAMRRMCNAPVELAIVRGATHLFEEPGKLEEVARLARDWFLQHCR